MLSVCMMAALRVVITMLSSRTDSRTSGESIMTLELLKFLKKTYSRNLMVVVVGLVLIGWSTSTKS